MINGHPACGGGRRGWYDSYVVTKGSYTKCGADACSAVQNGAVVILCVAIDVRGLKQFRVTLRSLSFSGRRVGYQ
jgi:hypothetical protein